MIRPLLLVPIALSLGLVACASEEAVMQPPAMARVDVLKIKAKAPPRVATALTVDERIRVACDLPTPHFDFDSSNVRATASESLDKLATCFLSGPMKGESMRLVGHADPRGDTEYNFALGQKRAGMIGDYLIGKGISGARITSTSRGELDAVGTDESGWQQDRRVDIRLVDRPR